MKILLVSDLHGNKEALDVLPEDYDVLICAGDLVDYGPDSKSVIRFIRHNARATVTGNHDKAAAYGIECGCGEVMRALSIATRAHLRLEKEETSFLAGLAINTQLKVGGVKILITHATPSDLYRYIDPDISDADLSGLFGEKDADLIVWGHTHLPWIRKIGGITVLNPGSLGQPRDGNPDASYAVWEDGQLEIIRKPYDRNTTAEKIRRGPLSKDQKEQLVRILFTGKT